MMISSKDINCQFVGFLVYHSIIDELIMYMKNTSIPLETVSDFLHFFACICRVGHTLRINNINKGAGDLLISYGKELLQSELSSV
jgi:hypothetical protein